jgi:hypothetical protein
VTENNQIITIFWNFSNLLLSVEVFDSEKDFLSSNRAIIINQSCDFVKFVKEVDALQFIDNILEKDFDSLDEDTSLEKIREYLIKTKTLDYKRFTVKKKIIYNFIEI